MEAAPHIDKALEHGHRYRWHEYSLQLWAELGNNPNSVRAANRLLEHYPDDVQGLRRYAEAEEAFQQALEIQPDSEWALPGLGRLLGETLGQPEEAEAIRQRRAALDTGGS